MTENTETKPKQRGNGPVVATFTNTDGSDSKRPNGPSAVHFRDRKGGAEHTLNLETLSIEALRTLAAVQATKYVETYARNHEDDEGATIEGLIAKRVKELQDGDIFVRTVGTGNGGSKVVDVSPWVDAYELMFKSIKKPFTEDMLTQFRANLLSKTGVERNKFIAGLKSKSAAYRAALAEVQAKLAKAKAKSIKDEINFEDFLA
jgi:hypothetical protein